MKIRKQSRILHIARQKGIEISISALLATDERRRRHLQKVEQLRQKRNQYTHNIQGWLREGLLDQVESAKYKVKRINHDASRNYIACKENTAAT